MAQRYRSMETVRALGTCYRLRVAGITHLETSEIGGHYVDSSRQAREFAEAALEAEQQKQGGEMDERTRRALFAQSLLENADLLHFPLRRHILSYLEETLAI